MNQQSKVMYLRKVFKTMILDSVKIGIMSDEGLREDFDRCVTLYKEFVNSQAQTIVSC